MHFVDGRQFASLNTQGALNDPAPMRARRFQRDRVAWQIPVSAATTATGSPDRSRRRFVGGPTMSTDGACDLPGSLCPRPHSPWTNNTGTTLTDLAKGTRRYHDLDNERFNLEARSAPSIWRHPWPDVGRCKSGGVVSARASARTARS